MLRRIAVLVLLRGILPAVSHALPRGPGPYAPAAVHAAEGWLAHLGRLLGGAWTLVTENTGVSRAPASRSASSGSSRSPTSSARAAPSSPTS